MIGKQTFGVDEPSSFTAWVIAPPNLDRVSYINKCLQTGTVLIKSIDNQIETYVQVDKGSIHYIRFPKTDEPNGSGVYCVKDPIYRKSKIVAILQDEDDEQTIFEENQWRINKKNGENFVDIDAKGNTGELDINVRSDKDNVESNFNFLSKNRKFVVRWLVQGQYILTTDDNITFNTEKSFTINVKDTSSDNSTVATITYTYGKGFSLSDEFGNNISTNSDTILIKNKGGNTISVDKGGLTMKTSEENLNGLLSDFIQNLISAVITTPSGVGAFNPETIVSLTEIKTRLSSLFTQP